MRFRPLKLPLATRPPLSRRSMRLFIVLSMILVNISACSTCLAGETLKIGTTMSPPLSVPERTGMLDLIITEAFTRAGIPMTLVTLPSERGLISASAGDTDGDINRVGGLTAKYPELVQVEESNMIYEFMAFSRRTDISVRGWNDLRKLSVGFITGWRIFEENVDSSSITKVDNPSQLFSLLQNDRVEVILMDRWGGGYYLKASGMPDGRALEPPLAKRDMFLYLNRRHSELVPKVAEALRSMKADGSYSRIVGRFEEQP